MSLRKIQVCIMVISALIIASTGSSLRAENASESKKLEYYRIWQGNSLPSFNQKDFLNILAQKFVPDTASTTPQFGMQTYMVIIPPASYSGLIPAEMALLQYSSEKDYQKMFGNPDGQRYAKSHWEVFQRNGSKSHVTRPFSHSKAEYFPTGWAYDVTEKPINWTNGHNQIFLGKRRKDTAKPFFMVELHKHVKKIKEAYTEKGLNGYIAVITPEYELAIQNWASKVKMEECLNSEAGKQLTKEAELLLEPLIWEEPKPFKGDIEPGKAYFVYPAGK